MSKKWDEQKERSNSFALNSICWVALHTSRSVSRIFLYPITLYFLTTSPAAYRASKSFLQRVLNRKISFLDVARHFFWFASTILDRVYFLTGQYEGFNITIHGRELIDDQVKKAEGCILLGSHTGSFEVLRTLAVNKLNMPLKIMMYRSHNQAITKIVDALSPRLSESVIDLADPNALLKMSEFIESGDIVGILGDRVSEGDRTIACDMLGETAEFNIGPMRLAAVLDVPVIFFVGLYRGGNKYEIYFEKLVRDFDTNRKNRDAQVEEYTKKYVKCLEKYVRYEPLNWFNYYDFWQDDQE